MLVIMVADIVLLMILRVYLDYENKKRNREQGVDLDPEARESENENPRYGSVMADEQADQTDWENKAFRYIL